MAGKEVKPRTGPTTWAKGKSGNPGGRSPRIGPNGETAAQLARMHTALAVQTLADVLESPKAPAIAKVAAANALLDRGWGKAKETIDLDANLSGGVPIIQIVRVSADVSGTD